LANILLIDDDPAQVATRQMILANAGHHVLVATNAPTAFGLLRSGTGNADVELIITDHFMPGTSGAELVKMLWEIKPATPIIVLSGAAEAEEEYEGLDVIFREKPIAPTELIELVKTILGNGNKAA
jgi:DNA-binding response OmpR family regulator